MTTLSPHIHRPWWQTHIPDIPRWGDHSALTELQQTNGSDVRKAQARTYLEARLTGADETDANRTVKVVFTPTERH
jgi:hypothetical protein